MSIVSKIKHLFHPIQGEIWCLHRVVKERSVFPSNRELEITPEYLECMILDYLKRGYEYVCMDELVGCVNTRAWDFRKKKRVVLSFDDGFRDLYDNAFPILKKYNIPFTVYLVSDFPDGKADIWWIQLEHLLDGNVERFEELMKEIYQSPQNMKEVMHQMTDSSADLELCKELSLTWEQLREMVDSGLCTVGGHTKTHSGLTRISNEKALYELTESKNAIENHLPVKVKHFSSPHSMENESIRSLIKEVGYETAVIGYGGSVRKGDDLFRLKRRYVVM